MAARLTAYVVVAIVGATLIAGLIVGAQRDDSEGPVDLIVRNGRVFTADRRGSMAEAVAIRGNQILRVGSDREIARLQRPQTVVVDARGGAVLPGFNDTQADLVRGGLATSGVDLAGAAGPAEAVERVARWGVANPSARWIVGRGWSPRLFRNAGPTRQLLDRAIGDRPAVLYSEDEASVWVSSAALRLAGITGDSTDPRGGAIARDPRTSEPSGLLSGSATALVEAALPPPGTEETESAIRTAMAHANAFGITSVQGTAASEEVLAAYDRLRHAGDLTVRVFAALPVTAASIPAAERDFAAFDDVRSRYRSDALFKTGALAVAVDAPLRSGGASLLAPYADATPSAEPRIDPDALNRFVRLADAAGWQVIVSSHGDRAVRMGLNAVAHAVRSNRAVPQERRHRLDGLGLVSEEDLGRFGPLRVAAAVQPLRKPGEEERADALRRRLGAARAEGLFPFRELAGDAPLLLGSGWPSFSLNPLAGVEAMVSDATAEAAGAPRGEDDPLEIEDAVRAYTAAGAWASYDEGRKGVLAPGMLADVVVLTEDIFSAPPSDISSASVAVTIFDGRIVYRAGAGTASSPK
jgi:predicted amidohydrolase YtcJ